MSVAAAFRPDGATRRFGPRAREIAAFLELLALTGIAVAQPVFDIVSKDATIFLTRNAGAAEIILYALVLVLAPPVVLWGGEVLVGLVLPRVRPYVHILLIAILTALIADEIVKKTTSWQWRPIVVAALVLGALATAVFVFVDVARVWLRFLAVAPVVFAMLFVFSSPISTLVLRKGPGADVRVAASGPSRVVMIVFDEFPLESLLDGTGHVDADLFPHFAQLARASTWYRNDGTVAPFTGVAVPAVLTGRYPTSATKPAIAAAYPQNLFTLLGGSYHMNVHESLTRLCPDKICGHAGALGGTQGGPGFDGLLHQSYDVWRDFWAPGRRSTPNAFIEGDTSRVVRIGRDFVDSIRPDSGPRLDFLHVLIPHWQWHLLATQDYDSDRLDGLFAYSWLDQWSATAAHQRHLLQLQAGDKLLGDVMAKLRAVGAWNDAMLVVTSDHGAAFTGREPFRGVSAANYPQIVWTPLFVKAPGQTVGAVDDRFARSIDVLPTMADLLHVRIPSKIDGTSLRGAPAETGTRRMFEWRYNELKPPDGSSYFTVDDRSGFAKVLTAKAWDARGDPTLRLYRIGPYGDLVGTRVSRDESDTGSAPTGALDDPTKYNDVVPDATDAPWVWTSGRLDVEGDGRAVAVTVEGVVAGLGQTITVNGHTEFTAVVAPQLFRRGHNDVGVALVDGDPRAPRLHPVTLTTH